MRLKHELTLYPANSTPSPAFFPTTTSSFTKTTYSGTPKSTAAVGSTCYAIPGSASQPKGHGFYRKTATTSVPTPAGLKPSYLILDEDIPFPDAFRLLGRLVANIKCPLEEYTPSQVILGAKIPGLDQTPTVVSSNDDSLKRQSSSASEANTTPSSPSGSSGVDRDDTNFARELEKYKTTLVFSNLPFTTSSSTTATITHRSQYSTKTNSLLTAMLGISISA